MKRSVILICLLLVTGTAVCAAGRVKTGADSLSVEIRQQLGSPAVKDLLFPASVKRFYASHAFHSVWFKPQTGLGPTWQAMLLIDCAEQFGLAGANYHQAELSYKILHELFEHPGTVSAAQQARFDILLSDAMIAFMNHLHYGRRNPVYRADQIDHGLPGNFHAELMLTSALGQTDLLSAVTSVQPTGKQYQDLQYQLYVLTGLHSGDNYQVSAADIKGISMSMERLRWTPAPQGAYIQVNIAAYTLTLYEPDSAYVFKILVGSPQHPTPRVQGAISSLVTTTGEQPAPMALRKVLSEVHGIFPERRAQQQLFAYPGTANSFIIKPRSRGENQKFDRQQRDLSEGRIEVENPEKLAALLLRYDGAENKISGLRQALHTGQFRTFQLKKIVPVKITYLTYLMKDGELVTYKDIYGLDRPLERALFRKNTQLILDY